MDSTPAGFDWDDANRGSTACRSSIESVFAGAPRVAPDPAHSLAETRLIAVGRRRSGRAAFIWRERGGETLIRPVSARYMHRKEVERYEASS